MNKIFNQHNALYSIIEGTRRETNATETTGTFSTLHLNAPAQFADLINNLLYI